MQSLGKGSSADLMGQAKRTPPERLQLDFIDGLRALAAIYIVLHHLLQTTSYMTWWLFPLRYGFEVVVVFIAISGFCLALPLGQRGQWKIDVRSFYRRRARRILPPYYAALALGLLIVLLYAARSEPQDYLGNRPSWAMVWSHAALVQNWMPSQSMTVDGPLWSIAVECQIYLLFPLLVLLRHHVGRWATLGLCFAAVQILARITNNGGYSFLLFIFAIGMLGADLAFHPSSRRWLIPGALLSAAGVFLTYGWHNTLAEALIGLATALLMAYLTQVRSSIGNTILGWRPLAWIGTFSYSIYLIHSYFEVGCARWLSTHTGIWIASTSAQRAEILLLAIPVLLLASYGFHLGFERPFMGKARQRAEDRLRAQADPGKVVPAGVEL